MRHDEQQRRVDDRGQVTPLMAVLVLAMAGIAVVVVTVGSVLSDRATARTAADAAALAAAVGTDADAAALAAENGAVLVAVHRSGVQVEVEVRRGRATARARAVAERRPPPSGGARSTGAVIP